MQVFSFAMARLVGVACFSLTSLQEILSARAKPKPKKLAAPSLQASKGKALGRTVPVRFNTNNLRCATIEAKAHGQRLPEWIRSATMKASGDVV